MIKSFKDFKLYEAENVEFNLDDEETPTETETPSAPTDSEPAAAEPPQSDKFEKLKADIKKMLTDTGNEEDILKKAKEESVESLNLKGFNQDSDVYDFYLAHQFEIDEKLNEDNFFDAKMSELGITGLYNAVIVGTQQAVKKFLQEM